MIPDSIHYLLANSLSHYRLRNKHSLCPQTQPRLCLEQPTNAPFLPTIPPTATNFAVQLPPITPSSNNIRGPTDTPSQKCPSITITGPPQCMRNVSTCIIEPTRKLAFHNRQRRVLPDLLDPPRALQESILHSWIILHSKPPVSFLENSIYNHMLNVSYICVEDDGSYRVVPS